MKKLILFVSCINSNASDSVDAVIVSLNHNEIAKIKAAQAYVIESGAEYVSLKTRQEWLNTCGELKSIDYSDLNALVTKYETAMRGEQIHVYADKFRLTGCEKHVGEEYMFKSDFAGIKDIDAKGLYFSPEF